MRIGSLRFARGISASLLMALPALAVGATAKEFIAACSPSQESAAPTVDSPKPSCVAKFALTTTTRIDYVIYCNNITGVTAAHIHNGDADTDGSVRHGLFSGPTTGAVNGVLTSGSFTRSGLGAAAFDSLLAKMRSDDLYVNVHTTTNGAGEVRGQIVGIVAPRVPALVF